MNRHTRLIAQTNAFSQLQNDCKEKLLKHAYVFESADFAVLETLAALFICVAEEGEVRELTLKRIFDGGYTDVVRMPRAHKNGKMDVEEAGYITDTAYYTPTELQTKYYIVAATEPLTPAVQNKLLKTLEEPPASARFIIFSSGNDLLPTVSSRCGKVRLEEFSVETIERALKEEGYDEVTALFAAAAARGNIGTAEAIAADKGYRAAYEAAVNFLLHVKRSPQILPSAGEMLANKENFGAVLDYFELLLRDCMAYSACGAQAVVLKPALGDIRTLSAEFTPDVCLELMPRIARARDRIRLYGNAASYIDELLFSVLEVKAKCLK